MTFDRLNKFIVTGGMTVAAALLLSTAAMAQEATDEETTVEIAIDPIDPAVSYVAVDGWVEGGDEFTIAVGEPDPNEGGDEGTDEGVDEGTDEGVDEGTDEGVDEGTDEGVDEGTDEGVDEGTDEGGDEGTYGEPDVVIDDGAVIVEDDVLIEFTSDNCIDCNVIPVHIYTGSEVERGDVLPASGGGSDRDVAAAPIVSRDMASCLASHPQANWICEWQNGAGQ